jgi:hypothetical protein
MNSDRIRVKDESVHLYDASYAHVFDNIGDDMTEYEDLCKSLLTVQTVVRTIELRSKTTYSRVVGEFLPTYGHPEFLTLIRDLVDKGNHRPALINLRLLREYLVRIGSGDSRPPWLFGGRSVAYDLSGDDVFMDNMNRNVVDMDLYRGYAHVRIHVSYVSIDTFVTLLRHECLP